MYNITRQEAAEKLSISTRSVDRYIKAGKLRSKKEGKIIYIHSSDIENMIGGGEEKKPEVIIPSEKKSYAQAASSDSSSQAQREPQSNAVMDAQSRATLEKIYIDLRSELKQKDQTIQDLSIKLGQAQEIAKNSVSLIEFKKSQFLLEESKGHITNELDAIKKEAGDLKKKLKHEKSTNMILIVFCVIFVITLGYLLFISI